MRSPLLRCELTVKMMHRCWDEAHTGFCPNIFWSPDYNRPYYPCPKYLSTKMPLIYTCCQLNLQLYRSRPVLKVAEATCHSDSVYVRQSVCGHYLSVVTSLHDGFTVFARINSEVKSTEVTCNKLHICLLHFPSKCQCLNCARSSARYATEVRCMRQRRSFVTLLQYSLLNYAL